MAYAKHMLNVHNTRAEDAAEASPPRASRSKSKRRDESDDEEEEVEVEEEEEEVEVEEEEQQEEGEPVLCTPPTARAAPRATACTRSRVSQSCRPAL